LGIELWVTDLDDSLELDVLGLLVTSGGCVFWTSNPCLLAIIIGSLIGQTLFRVTQTQVNGLVHIVVLQHSLHMDLKRLVTLELLSVTLTIGLSKFGLSVCLVLVLGTHGLVEIDIAFFARTFWDIGTDTKGLPIFIRFKLPLIIHMIVTLISSLSIWLEWSFIWSI